MKTIFISIPLGIVARNILRTDVFRILKAQKGVRIVLITPPNIDSHFRKEIESENVIIEEWRGRVRAGFFRHFILYPFMRNLVYTETSKIFFRYGNKLSEPRNTPVCYFFSRIFFGPLSKITFLKRFCRRLDYNFFSKYDQEYESLFNKYQPSLVFVNNLLHEPVERALLRIARRRCIPSVGMVKSWDNFDKQLFIALPDTFLVWNGKMKQDLIKLQDVKSEDIIMTGVPQFDIYKKDDIFLSREEYCRRLGIDPSLKIIFFGCQWTFPYDNEIVEILHQYISKGDIKKKCVILVRPHFEEYARKTGQFERFRSYQYAVLDKPERTGRCFFRYWNPNLEDVEHLANNLFHCDILITSYSTLSIDAVVFDKPIINIAFDGFHQKPWAHSIQRVFKYHYYQPIVSSRAVRLVYNKEELKDVINQYLEDPSLDSEQRKKLRQKFCYKFDGKAGQRIAQCILNALNENKN